MKKLVVALDIDGVVLNFMQSISKFMEERYGVKSAIDHCHEQYSLRARFDPAWIESVGFNNIKAEFAKAGGWSSIEMMHSTEFVKALFTNPLIDVHIVTMIDPEFKFERKANLEKLLGLHIPAEKLYCMPMTSSKKPVIDALKPDVFVEDSLSNINICAGDHVSIWIDTAAYDKKVEATYQSEDIISVLHFDEAYQHIESLLATRNQVMLPQIISLMQQCFTDDLLNPKYRNMPRDTPAEGHCYAAAEALYHALGGQKSGYTPQYAPFTKNGVAMTHWWLRSKDGTIVDPTASQFTAIGMTPPYEAGKSAGFLTRLPSKRATLILSQVFSATPSIEVAVPEDCALAM